MYLGFLWLVHEEKSKLYVRMRNVTITLKKKVKILLRGVSIVQVIKDIIVIIVKHFSWRLKALHCIVNIYQSQK